MTDLQKDKATICVVNYKTPLFIKLCLRSIRKFTAYPYEVIVVDNDSQDESTQYLKSLKWIRLIERRPDPDEQGGFAHGAGLDAGLKNCNTEYFVALHSDVFIQEQDWLTHLIKYFTDENVACVGTGKIELAPPWRHWLKKATDYRTFARKLLRKPDPLGIYRYYNRTICCLYRTRILNNENLSFRMDQDKGITAGKKLYFELVDRGYKTVELPSKLVGAYLVHLAHATQVVNPDEFKLRIKTIKKTNRWVNRVFSSELAQNILFDDSLDK